MPDAALFELPAAHAARIAREEAAAAERAIPELERCGSLGQATHRGIAKALRRLAQRIEKEVT